MNVWEVVVVVERLVVGTFVMREVVSGFGAGRPRREEVVAVVGSVFGAELLSEGRKKGADLGTLGASSGLLRCLVDLLVSWVFDFLLQSRGMRLIDCLRHPRKKIAPSFAPD